MLLFVKAGQHFLNKKLESTSYTRLYAISFPWQAGKQRAFHDFIWILTLVFVLVFTCLWLLLLLLEMFGDFISFCVLCCLCEAPCNTDFDRSNNRVVWTVNFKPIYQISMSLDCGREMEYQEPVQWKYKLHRKPSPTRNQTVELSFGEATELFFTIFFLQQLLIIIT